MADEALRPYQAMIWTKDPDLGGKRVSVLATSLAEARRLLEAEYGEGNVFDLHNEDDANKRR